MTLHVEREGDRIIARWGHDGFMPKPEWQRHLDAVKTIPGRRWLKDRQGRPWSLPLDLTVCRTLRREMGEGPENLQIGPELRSWAIEAKRSEERLGGISAASSGKLEYLPTLLPTLYRALYLGPLGKHAVDQLGYTPEQIDWAVHLFAALTHTQPWDPELGSYQTADVRYLADSDAPLNANHQGLGKTLEAIAAVWEGGDAVGCHLVSCPKGAVETVWVPELLRWQADAACSVAVFSCVDGNRAQRQAMLEEFQASDADVKWVVINPEMVRYEKDPTNKGKVAFRAKPKEYDRACDCDRLVDPHWHYVPRFPILFDIVWNTVINDEVHKGNIRNQRSLTAKSMYDLKQVKPVAMSGTPMKGKGADIWGILHWLRPKVFTSYWNFVDTFFHVEEVQHGRSRTAKHKEVGLLREDMEDEFYRYLAPYMLRRTKAECLPWLPAKQHIFVEVELGAKQRRLYDEMFMDCCAVLEDRTISASSILAQYTRLQQFANAVCELRDGDVMPTAESAKLDALWERLEEAGTFDGVGEPTVIFSMSRRMIELVADMLEDEGVSVAIVSGKSTKDRPAKVKAFQAGEIQVLCVVTTAGGVALTLDAADTAHFLDESWAPDDQEQAEDRVHRASRIHQVTIYHYRAKDTIDEDKADESLGKATQHERIMNLRKRLLAKREAAA